VSEGRTVDESFLALPLSALTDAALTRAIDLGCEHADIRVERIRAQTITLRDARLEAFADAEDLGLSVRVIHEGTWGFAAGVVLTAAEAVRLAEEAVTVAQVSAAVNSDRVELAPEPVYADATYVSAYDVDPFEVADADKTALLVELSEQLLAADGVEHVQSGCMHVKEQKYYADTAGTRTRQQRVRIHPEFTALTVDRTTGQFESMRTLAPPAGRGWEYLTDGTWNWRGELAEIPELLREKTKAPSVQAGRYDLVVDPSNLFLTIHESIGHATELDRALGYEAAYAGTSFATVDKLGTLQYGSALMNVTGDRVAWHGLSTIGWDDEGVAGQQWDIIKDGVLVGYQVDRNMARLRGLPRSNGCAFADSPGHVPVQRMANVSLQPAPDGPSTEEIIAGVERGIYVVGDKSWSIDMQRYNFQFTGQRFYRIENGRLAGQLRDVAYQATTTEFWGSMSVVGGPQTYVLGGAFNCGKAQPGQVAPVSHGCPSALFENVNILNTVQEGGR
jgi:TldD protein